MAEKRIEYIPARPPKREKRVGIYCRVSTNSVDQLKSLTAQISALTRLTSVNPKWLLVDVYTDIASSKQALYGKGLIVCLRIASRMIWKLLSQKVSVGLDGIRWRFSIH